MKYLLLALGSRGDIEPFLAVAQQLKKEGHQVICAFPAQFETDTKELGLISHPFSPDFLEISKTPECKLILGGAGTLIQKIIAYRAVYRALKKIIPAIIWHEKSIIDQAKPDYVIFNPLCNYSVYWSYYHPHQSVYILSFPFIAHEDDHHHFLMMRGTRDRGKWVNRLSYTILNDEKMRQIKKIEKHFPIARQANPVDRKKLKQHFLHHLESWYPLSKYIFDRPALWGENVKLTGYFEREPDKKWIIPDELQLFLNRYDKITLVSFGSMTNDRPELFTQMVIDIAKKHGLAVIINTASGGFHTPDSFPDHIRFVEYIPYSLILPHIYAVLHHGGTGTTHLSVKYGCVSILVPHILDQFFWADTIFNLKLGPKGIPIFKLTPALMEDTLLDALQNKEYKTNAEMISRQMETEHPVQYVIQLMKKSGQESDSLTD